ncbi:MAG: hypothetical protein KGM15_02395 [Pseudomonadota bacterium]|nr:hypothetical protein [Pseudomonadota bacterium]
MSMVFKHPLARKATLTTAHLRKGVEKKVLLVVTTLELDPQGKGYSAKNVERLHDAARAHLAQAPELAGYVIVDRPKDWDA